MTSQTDLTDHLAQCWLFSSLSHRELRRLAESAIWRRFRPGEVIVHEGDPGVAFYVLTSGSAQVVRSTEAGKPRVLATKEPGDFFGEMSLVDGAPRSASVVALADSECAVFIRWDFLAELRLHPEMAFGLLQVFSERIRTANAERGGEEEV